MIPKLRPLPMLVLALAAAADARAQASVPGLKVEPCTFPGVEGPARCGTLEVWENRTARSGRKIPIRFVVIPATGGAPAREAIVPLAGGPGQAATTPVAGVADELKGARGTRDVLAVDQRGTGGSNLLACKLFDPADAQSYLTAFYPAEGVRRCGEEWREKADLTQYTSDPAADDLDEVRAALGYEKLDLYGVSYGTRAAQVYLRRHPEHVRAVILHGALPNDVRMPLHVAPDAQRAMEGVLGECEREAACRAAFPNLRAELDSAVARLERRPARVAVMHPTTGEPDTVTLTRNLFGEALRYMLYDASTASLVPVVVHQAARGDYGPAAEQALSGRRGIVDEGSHGVYLSVTCAEDVPFFEMDEGLRMARGSFLGEYRVRDQKAACDAWPHRPAAREFLEPVRSDVPVLLVTGQWDPVTPPWQAEAVLRTLPNGRFVQIPSAGHGFGGLQGTRGCVDSLTTRFVRTADAKGLDTSCVAAIRRPPFPTEPLPTTPVRLTEAELAAFTGTFRAADGFRMVLKVEGGRLHSILDGNRDFPLTPVGPERFRVTGMPFIFLTFVREGGAVTAMVLNEGAAPPTRFERVR